MAREVAAIGCIDPEAAIVMLRKSPVETTAVAA